MSLPPSSSRTLLRPLRTASAGRRPPTSLYYPHHHHHHHHQRRTFFPHLVPNAEQVLTAQRTSLPYPPSRLFALIADIDSYSRFLPYCKTSRVTAWTSPSSSDGAAAAAAPEEGGKRKIWPTRADLTAGWGALEQTYTSRVFCVPGIGRGKDEEKEGGIVEAISGSARTTIPLSVLSQHGLRDPGPDHRDRDRDNSAAAVFESLVTRWTVSPAAAAAAETGTGSDVRLSIRFRFANPLYGALSSAVADRVASLMVEAFVERARRVLSGGR
ncbi:dehydrase and lipid transport-domain-containing protein [Biscogniauxia mediterranea]|nr:dehydrase and lipid transport-domain-containing protein [Biscogniauxia mediterranea]